jgi:hypothetical protein
MSNKHELTNGFLPVDAQWLDEGSTKQLIELSKGRIKNIVPGRHRDVALLRETVDFSNIQNSTQRRQLKSIFDTVCTYAERPAVMYNDLYDNTVQRIQLLNESETILAKHSPQSKSLLLLSQIVITDALRRQNMSVALTALQVGNRSLRILSDKFGLFAAYVLEEYMKENNSTIPYDELSIHDKLKVMNELQATCIEAGKHIKDLWIRSSHQR